MLTITIGETLVIGKLIFGKVYPVCGCDLKILMRIEDNP
jgi:hypothetical protein